MLTQAQLEGIIADMTIEQRRLEERKTTLIASLNDLGKQVERHRNELTAIEARNNDVLNALSHFQDRLEEVRAT